MVLPLSIQPFVENAVKHGVVAAKNGGTVWIRSRMRQDFISIEIEDNGVGFHAKERYNKEKDGSAVGMKSAIYRIRYDMGGECTVTSSVEAGVSGTLVRIELPVKRGDKR